MVLLGESKLYQQMVDFTRMVILLGSLGALNIVPVLIPLSYRKVR